jgi:hypothetical protein
MPTTLIASSAQLGDERSGALSSRRGRGVAIDFDFFAIVWSRVRNRESAQFTASCGHVGPREGVQTGLVVRLVATGATAEPRFPFVRRLTTDHLR